MGGRMAPPQTTTITSSLRQIPPLPQPCKTHLPPPSYPRKFFPRATSRRSPQATIVAARAPVGSIAAGVSSPGVTVSTPVDIVRAFYDGMNQRDFASVAHLIAEDCVYEDLVFSEPFVGRKAIIEYFEKFLGSLSTDLKVRIDDLPAGDSTAVGLTWHFEWQGKAFPFSRGCSFYRLDLRQGKKQIVYGRDCVEPAIKAGELTLVIIQGVVWILRRFPQLANLM